MAEAALFIGWGEPARGRETLANRDICVHTMTAPPISAPSYALAAQIRRAVNGMWEDSGPDLRHETVRPVEPPNLFRVIKAGSQAAGSRASPYTIEAMHPTAFSLSNWEAIKANDFGRVFDGPCNELPQGPCGWTAWDLRAQSTVIQPTMDVYNAAKDRGAAIFFITGRDETQRAATERNLQVVGYTVRSPQLPPTPSPPTHRSRSKARSPPAQGNWKGGEMSTSAIPPDEPVWTPNHDDEIRWGRSRSGNVPAGSPEDYADRAGLPRLPDTQDGIEHIHIAQDAAKQQRCWPRAGSEFDPARPGTPAPGFRAAMAPVSDPRVGVTRQPATSPSELLGALMAKKRSHVMTPARQRALRKAQLASAKARHRSSRHQVRAARSTHRSSENRATRRITRSQLRSAKSTRRASRKDLKAFKLQNPRVRRRRKRRQIG